MFLNDTILMLMYTANMITTMRNETQIQSPAVHQVIRHNITTTTLPPEEEENAFDLEDGKNENNETFIYI